MNLTRMSQPHHEHNSQHIQIQPALLQLLQGYQRSGLKFVQLSAVETYTTVAGHSRPAKQHGTNQTYHSDRNLPQRNPPNERQKMNTGTLEECVQRVAQCTRCHELAPFRTQTVFGVGDPQADIMFVGEAPGADEDKQGEPFVGRAGQLLNSIIAACNMQRKQIYICNILKCHPPGNRNPTDEEAANCRDYLDRQIELVNPKYIVCWGAISARNLLSSTETIGRLRGRFYDYNGVKVLCTYHPSYLLRNPAAKKDVWHDMKILFADMGITLQNKQSS